MQNFIMIIIKNIFIKELKIEHAILKKYIISTQFY